jgi:hypothetical protein
MFFSEFWTYKGQKNIHTQSRPVSELRILVGYRHFVSLIKILCCLENSDIFLIYGDFTELGNSCSSLNYWYCAGV